MFFLLTLHNIIWWQYGIDAVINLILMCGLVQIIFNPLLFVCLLCLMIICARGYYYYNNPSVSCYILIALLFLLQAVYPDYITTLIAIILVALCLMAVSETIAFFWGGLFEAFKIIPNRVISGFIMCVFLLQLCTYSGGTQTGIAFRQLHLAWKPQLLLTPIESDARPQNMTINPCCESSSPDSICSDFCPYGKNQRNLCLFQQTLLESNQTLNHVYHQSYRGRQIPMNFYLRHPTNEYIRHDKCRYYDVISTILSEHIINLNLKTHTIRFIDFGGVSIPSMMFIICNIMLFGLLISDELTRSVLTIAIFIIANVCYHSGLIIFSSR
jgi:hypothetical protein